MPPAPASGRSDLPAVLLGLTSAALVALLLWSAGHGHLPQFQGKAMGLRLVCSPVAATVVPVGWWLARRARPGLAFPVVPALLVVLSLVVDLAGNATRLYDSVEHFDDAVHALNPVLLVAALALVLRGTGVPPWANWVMAFGVGCAGNILWEVLEYVLMARVGAVELALSLPDTLSDQSWGLLGAAVGASVPLLVPSDGPERSSGDRVRQAPDHVPADPRPSLTSSA